MDAQQTSQNTEEKYCVGRESNPDQLLGRQLCWPLYHRRCADPSASQRSSENQLARILGSLCHEHQCRISWANGQLTNLCVHVLLFINECYLLQWWRSPLRKGLYSSVAERWSCKPKVMSSILIGGMLFLTQVISSVCEKKILTPTWFEHAAFWSGVRRATVAPRSQVVWGPTEIWTRIAGFKVQSANHYTIEPYPVLAWIKEFQLSSIFNQDYAGQFWFNQFTFLMWNL